MPQETPNPFAFMMGGKNKKKPVEYLKEKLEAEGFEVTIYESMMDKILKAPEEEAGKMMLNMYAGKATISSITDNYDLIIQLAEITNLFGVTQRINWKMSKGTPDIPWYVHEVCLLYTS